MKNIKKITLLTKSNFLIDKLGYIILNLFCKNKRRTGPQMVVESVLNGGLDLFQLNSGEETIGETVYIPCGIRPLKYAFHLKKRGKIKKIIAGPNISVPQSEEDIRFNPLIDTIIVPSDREYNRILSINPKIKNKLRIWPTGVKITNISKKIKKKLLVYIKNAPEAITEYVISSLNKRKIEYKIIRYGEYKHSDYLELLNTTIGMIYLQESETQGIALQEARMKNVATLVWNRCYRGPYKKKFTIIGFVSDLLSNNISFKSKKNEYRYDEKISAPYLNSQSGDFYYGIYDFNSKLENFINKIKKNEYSPREYCINKLSDKVCSRRLFDIINGIEK